MFRFLSGRSRYVPPTPLPDLPRATALAAAVAIAVAVSLLATGPALAQQAPPTSGGAEASETAFGERIDVRVVNVDVYVTDRRGERIRDLTREDFELRVNGEEIV